MEFTFILIIILISITPLFLARESNNGTGLKPFEFSRNYSSPSPQLSEMSNEKAIIILLFAWTVPSITSFAINLYQNQIEFDYEYSSEFFGPIYKIIYGVQNLILLWVGFSVRLRRWRVVIISLVLLQMFIYIYWNFLSN